MGGADRADPARLVRDADEPAPEGHRHRGVGRVVRERAAQAGRAGPLDRRRQHVRLARPAAAARARRRHRVPLGDEVPRRPLRHDPRRRGHARRRGRRAAAVPPERDGRRARAVRLLPRPARAADAPPAGRAPRGQRHGRRPVPRRSRRHRVGLLSGPGRRAARAPRRARSRPARCAAGGGMVSFVPRRRAAARTARERAVAICEATRLFTLAESLGGVESLIEVPGRDDPPLGRRLEARGRRGPGPAVGRDRGASTT